MAVWHTAGVKSVDEARSREVVAGASARGAITFFYPTMMNELLGTRFKIVTGYAGGNEINLAMVVPTLAWRPLVDFKKADIVDLSTGAGVYWFSSDAGLPGSFEPFRGLVLEPIRIDLHFPSIVTKDGLAGAILAGLSYRRGWAIFPHGFAANAFGTTSTPEQARQISAEWVKTSAIFWDFAPLIHYGKVGRIK